MGMLTLLLSTHIQDPHKLSAKQIIGHIAPKKNLIMCGPLLSETPDRRVRIYYHILTREIFGVLSESLPKKRGGGEQGTNFTPETMFYGSLMSEKPDFRTPSDFIPKCTLMAKGIFWQHLKLQNLILLCFHASNDVNVSFSSQLFSTW